MSKSKIHQFHIGSARVYVAEFDENVEVKPVAPTARQKYIESCSDTQAKRQRYCVWMLLDHALKHTVGKGVDELTFTQDINGKWHCGGGISFSLSHCGNVVAVAVSEQPVGIDVERIDEQRFNARLARRILTEGERVIYEGVPFDERSQILAKMWTMKESLFKRDGGKSFTPSAIDTTASNAQCLTITVENKQYLIAVANA